MLIDSHCHLDFSCFDLDRSQVLDKCQALGINTIVIPGTQARHWDRQIAFCQRYQQLRFALGLHPYFLAEYKPSQLDHLRSMIQQNKNAMVAIGEIGLDAVIDIDWSIQVKVFQQQLMIATENSLPVIVHHRNSHNELIRILKRVSFSNGGIIHAFSGSMQQAHTYIDLGFKIGIGGSITYPRANKTKATIQRLPLSSLVLETDAPDMPIMGKQGIRNSPEYLPEIMSVLLSIRSESESVLLEACRQNTRDALLNL